ncbi:DUF2726 domain-containing protein [Trinickia dinghuensis]|uniref:DUF2726 domain-containing protein n=1 Tax=Trinickia dinghuensis TaxID=2291023 RepID=A0A3D8K108_9BURK|nr:DUF2726 domain-containing protein [Trinickia dinghuensis]RDU98929.1 DUF2726 domain-containing protein [Trinickia dinghuensis]
MSPSVEKMRELLEARDVDGFLTAYLEYRQGHVIEPEVTALTQRTLPSLLRQAFAGDLLAPKTIIKLWRVVRDGRLILVDDDLLIAINLRIDNAMREADPDAKLPAARLITSEQLGESQHQRRSRPEELRAAPHIVQATVIKRVAIVSTFNVGVWSAVDAFDFRKNVCASQQEREFLRAVRQYFPSLQAYPNLPLRSFIDIERLEGTVPTRARSYAWSAQVDVLLCTADEDPVVGIELDSIHHDTDEAAERDELKNLLFTLSGLPLVRIRAGDEKSVRAEDFYDLLMSESKMLDTIRPRRLRPRRTHDFLVPDEVHASAASMR